MDLKVGIVQILGTERKITGAGFLVSNRGLIATCSHVVQSREDQKRGLPKPKQIAIVFEASGKQEIALVNEQWWRSWDSDDVAILSLEGELPDTAKPLPIGNSNIVDKHSFISYGYSTTGRIQGIWADGEIIGLVSDKKILQLKSDDISVGFSGAPVWCEEKGFVIGMINWIKSQDKYGKQRTLAFGCTSEILIDTCNEITIQSNYINPFFPLAGRLDKPEYLFGREVELGKIFRYLNEGNNVAIIGEPAVGKSSILTAVLHQAENQLSSNRHPVYISMGAITSNDEFFYTVCDGAGIPRCKGIELPRKLKERKLLLILDDIRVMDWDDSAHRIRFFLRSMSDGINAPLRLVIAASKPLEDLFPGDERGPSPFFNVCVPINIKRWDEKTVRRFISTRLAPTPISFSEQEIVELLNRSQGHPRYVVLGCHDLFEKIKQQY